jgi:preprotein translocase subunit SecA
MVQKAEADLMREKRLHELDESLLFAMDEKGHNVHLSDRGIDEMSPDDPDAFLIPDLSEAIGEIQEDEDLSEDEKRERVEALEAEYAAKSERMHVIHQLLKAYALFQRDEQYIIGEDGQVVIVDEFTGRQMAGRRWSDGLHQAVEAKEGVEVKGETQTLATVTIQNYFRMYDKLAGMTGTAETEENEFHQIYNLDVLVIPTNRPIVRDDRNDLIFKTKREKYNALMDEIGRLHKMELPVLLGTTNVEVSETVSRMLKRRGIPHNVLNAKQHKREAEIVAGAGRPGAVTIATNMAGRGTDIKLGEGVTEARTVAWAKARELDLEEIASIDPNLWKDLSTQPDDFLIEPGGLHILGSERHESRRIDRQLRGRAGRQGDPGATQFFLSLEDDLMRLFGSDRIASAMEKWGAEDGEVITHGLVTKSIERAQKRVEGNNFEARKRLLDYDDVMNQQREVIYDLRLFALEGGEDLRGETWEMIETAVTDLVEEHTPDDTHPDEWDLHVLRRRLLMEFFIRAEGLPENETAESDFVDREEVMDAVLPPAREQFERKLESFGEHAERLQGWVLLSVLDDKWKDHLYDLDALKASISFRGWGQKDPLIEYKKEAYDMFVGLMEDIRKTVTSLLFRAQLGAPQPQQSRAPQRLQYTGPDETVGVGAAAAAVGAGPQRGGARLDPVGVAATARAEGADPARMVTNREAERPQEPVTVEAGPGRNDPCPCGSGKKFKKCHGAVG